MSLAFTLKSGAMSSVERMKAYSLFPGGYQPDAAAVLLYKLDEGMGGVAVDYSDQGSDGVITGAAWVASKYGYGLYFDGVDDYIVVAHKTEFNLADSSGFCIEAWVKPEHDGMQRMVEKAGAYYLGVVPHGAKKVRFDAGIYNGGVLQQLTGWAFGIGAWKHVAFQRGTDGYLSLVVDGSVQVTSDAACDPPDVNENGPYVGRNSSGNYLKGALDELRISNRYRDTSSLDPNR